MTKPPKKPGAVPPAMPAYSALIEGAGSRLAAARRALGYRSQTEFAKAFGITSQRLNQWEQGVHPPDLIVMCALKARHGVPLDWVYMDDTTHMPMSLAQSIMVLGAAPDAPTAAVKLRFTFGNMVGQPVQRLHERPQEPYSIDPPYPGPQRPGFGEAATSFDPSPRSPPKGRSKPT